jgi:modulator of FtsH protease
MSSWQVYFAAQAGAAAALSGLIFVALSLNLERILKLPSLPERALEALIVLVQPLLVGLAGAAPALWSRSLGTTFLTIGVAAWLFVTILLVRAWPLARRRPLREFLIRSSLAETATLLAPIAGILLLAGSTAGLEIQLAGAMVCLVVGIEDGWVLLVEIRR